MTREVIVNKNIKLKDVCKVEELVVATADLPDDFVWLVIVTPPPEAGEVKVIG